MVVPQSRKQSPSSALLVSREAALVLGSLVRSGMAVARRLQGPMLELSLQLVYRNALMTSLSCLICRAVVAASSLKSTSQSVESSITAVNSWPVDRLH